jgi:hypothetical protein
LPSQGALRQSSYFARLGLHTATALTLLFFKEKEGVMSAVLKSASTHDYHVADISLADFGN